MKHAWMSLSCVVVMFALVSTVAAQTNAQTTACDPVPLRNRCAEPQRMILCPLCIPCGCQPAGALVGQVLCLGDPQPCDPGHRIATFPLGLLLCEYSGYSEEPTTNSTVIVPPQKNPDDLWGWADTHEHQFANLAFGGLTVWGSPFEEGGVNDALPWCDYTSDFTVQTSSLFDLAPRFQVLPFFTWGNPIHGSNFVQPPFFGPPLQFLFGLMVNIATDDSPLALHSSGGTGPFDGWPSFLNGGHQQMYYKWLERAYQGGMRLLVNLAVHNEVLCEVSFQREGFGDCNDMLTAERQIEAMYALEAFIDRQCIAEGRGVGCGWYRIATSSQQAREIISAGKMAVVIGIEVDSLFDCKPDDKCTEAHIREQVNRFYDLGLRYVIPVHLFDNKFGGPAIYEDIFSYANWLVTGMTFETWDCSSEGYDYKVNPFEIFEPINFAEILLALARFDFVPLIDFVKALLANSPGFLYAGLVPFFGEPFFEQEQVAHCNAKGLEPRGEFLLNTLMEKDMFIDIDHMSHRMLDGFGDTKGTLQVFQDSDGTRGYAYPPISGHPVIRKDYDGVNSIKNELTHTVRRVKLIRELGGLVAVNVPRGKCKTTREWITGDDGVFGYNDIVAIMDGDNECDDESKCDPSDPDACQGIGDESCDAEVPFYGEGHPAISLSHDMGSFLKLPGPRFGPDGKACDNYDPNAPRLRYPFKAFDMSGEFSPQRTGDRCFDFNEDGLAHVGLLPDLLADVRTISGRVAPHVDLDPFFNSAETFIRMWERIENCTPDEDAPTIGCNAPPTVSAEDVPISFTATATDDCDGGAASSITHFECHLGFEDDERCADFITPPSCAVRIDGGTITVLDPGEWGDRVNWTVLAVDNFGNEQQVICEIEVPAPDLFVEKTCPPEPAAPGTEITFSLEYGNMGSLPGYRVSLTEQLPAGTTFVSASKPVCAQTGGNLSFCPGDCVEPALCRGDVAPGFMETIEITVRVDTTTGELLNAAFIKNQIQRCNPAHSSDMDTCISVVEAPDLEVTNTGPDRAIQGTSAEFILTVTNGGAGPAEHVVLVDRFNPWLMDCTTLVTNPTQGTCRTDCDFGVVTCDLGVVRGGQSASVPISIPVLTATGVSGVIDNCAEVTTTTPETSTANNSMCIQVPVKRVTFFRPFRRPRR